MRRQTLGRLVPLVLATFLLAACTSGGSNGTSTDGAPAPGGDATGATAGTTKGGTLTVGLGGYPTSFNPNQAKTAPANSVYRAILQPLVYADSQDSGKLTPALATEWTLDGTAWVFTLRDGVKWSDGSDFTADDVVATIDLMQHGEPASQYLSRISFVTGVTAVDPHTVRFETNGQSATLPAALSDVYVYQKAQIDAGGNDAINSGPIGTGPFKLDSKQDGVEVTVVRNDLYWGDAPALDKVIFKAIADDSTRTAALQAGEIDVAFNVPPDTAKALDGQGGIAIQWTPIGQGMVLSLVTGSPDIAEPLKSAEVRQALNYAVDTQAIVDSALLGYGAPLQGQVLGSDGVGYDPDIPAFGYDPDKAKQMLADAGYPDGFSMTIYTATGRYVKQQEIPQLIAGYLQQVGIQADVKTLEWSDLNAGVSKGAYGATYSGWNYYPTMDGDAPFQLYTCNAGRLMLCDQQFDDLLTQERSEFDPDKRVALLQQMSQILHDQAPAIFLFQSPDVFGVRSNVHGFTPTADDMIHVETISVD